MKYLNHFRLNRYLLQLLLLTGLSGITSCNPSFQQERAELTDAQKRLTENALAGLEVGEGLEASLFAAEPQLINPTNIDVDAKGRIWVCEAYNYRMHLNPDNPSHSEGDRILILEDTDQDGKADKSTVFYQGNDINAALGIAVLGNRIFVSVSPNVFVFTDEDGDDVPDKKEILYTGIGGEQHDHGMHAFVFGPDGRLYFNYGNAGEQLTDANGKVIVDIHGYPVVADGKPFHQGMVFRCNPDGSEVEVLGNNFRNNYEVAVDSYGTLWQSDNDDDGNRGVRINFVMEYGSYGYRDEMTGAGWRDRRTGMHEEIPKRHWHLNDPGTVPNLLQTGAGSPTGMAIYEGDLLPARFQGQMIHCDAGPNVVRSYPVTPDGAGYTAQMDNLLKGSADNWFRPSDVCVAPDGSLFVADWYDPGVGGHKMGDQERGRIYRIAPPGHAYQPVKFDLETPASALEALKSPNMSIRYLAWQRFAEWGETGEAALQGLWRSDNPRFRARALWLLARIPGKTQTYVEMALADANPDIRITGLRAARQLLPESLPDYVQRVAKDASPQVRREAAIALRHYSGKRVAELWASLATQYSAGDRWYLEALGIGSAGQPDACFDAWMKAVDKEWNTPAGRDIVWRVRARKALPLLATIIEDPANRQADLYRYFRAFDFHTDDRKDRILAGLLDLTHPDRDLINRLVFNHISGEYVAKSKKIWEILERSLTEMVGTEEYIAVVESQDLRSQAPQLLKMATTSPDVSLRVDALRLLFRFEQGSTIVDQIAVSESNATVLLNALGALGTGEARKMISEVMMDDKNSLLLRKSAVQALGSGWGGEHDLIKLLEEDKLPADLVQVAAARLTSAIDGSLRPRAAAFLDQSAVNASNLPPVAELVSKSGDPTAGKTIFERQCGICHQVDGQGVNFGPDLSEIGNKLSREALYAAIFYPSAGVSFGYEGYLITLDDGTVVSGFITSETETTLTVRMNGGISQSYDVSKVTKRQQMDISLMPEGLPAAMTEKELVDLVSYLETRGKPL